MTEAPMTCEEIRLQLMALLDGELELINRESIQRHLQSCAECSQHYEALTKLKKGTDEMKLLKLPEFYWQEYWTHVYNRIERGIAWILLSLGAIMLLAIAGFQMTRDFFLDPTQPLFLRLGMGIFSVGAIILFVSVIREKLMIRKVDKYRSVQR